MSTRSRSSRIGRVTVPAVALALLLSACGSDDQAGTPAPAPSAESSVAASSMMPAGSAGESMPAESSTESSAQESSAEESSAEESSAEESSAEESSAEESSTEESESSTEETESSTEESSTESSTEESSTDKKTPVAPAKAKAPTKPGTKLKVGEPAVIEFQTFKKGEKYYQHGFMTTTVTKIVKADPKIFDKLDNKAEFKNLVPYFVFTEAEILSYEGAKDGNPPQQIVIYGLLPDGSEAGKAIGLASLDGCDSTFFQSADVGEKSIKCSVTLAEKGGEPVVGAEYEGDNDLYEDSSDNPYSSDPVVWGP